MDPAWLPVILLCLLASAFSSGMEIAYITSNKLKIELDRKQGVFGSSIIAHLARRPKLFIAAMLVGNNIALVVYGLYMGDMLVYLIERSLPGFSASAGDFGMLLTQTTISTLIVLVFSEYIPKAIFSTHPNRWLGLFALPLMVWYGVLWGFAWFVTSLSDGFLRLIGRPVSSSAVVEFGRVDLHHYLEEMTGAPGTTLNLDHEIQIFQNALDFSKVKARDCMIPRNEIVAIEITESIDHLRGLFIETRLSKILVYRENIDHIIGYVHSFELFRRPGHIQHILRPVSIVPEPMAANKILELFIKKKRNMAVVVDEFGGTAGIVTMEDIVEEIFGEIEDEHDKEENLELQVDERTFEFSARLEIDYLNEKYHLNLPADDAEYDTLGGLLLYLREDIPDEGTSVPCGELTLTVTKVSDRRIEHVRVHLIG
ncbi:MAG: hemolysin family protein [Flavobacteriales bacterium]|jgi:putative hemolysin